MPAGHSHVVAIAALNTHALALKADGTVVAWGSNSLGETDVPAALSGITAISAGAHHSLALHVKSAQEQVAELITVVRATTSASSVRA